MAQPARAVRVRRSRSRRRPTSGKRPDQLPNIRVFSQTEWFWNAWIIQCVSAFAPRSTPSRRAVSDARSILSGDPFPPLVETPRLPLRARLALRRPSLASFRLAAHLVTASIVVLALLVAQIGPELVYGQIATSSRAHDEVNNDFLLQRTVGQEAEAGPASEHLPETRQFDPTLAPVYSESHVVAEGETLAQIAAQYHISVAALFWANDLASKNVFAVGQELRVPRMEGVPYVVAEGDTVEAIAKQFQVRPQAITLFKANGIQPGEALFAGQELFVPNGKEAYPEDLLARLGGETGIGQLQAVAAGTVRESETNLRAGPGRGYEKIGVLDAGRRLKLIARHDVWVKVEDGAGQTGWVRSDLLGLSEAILNGVAETNDFPALPPVWIWPTQGRITSPFGWRRAPFRSFHDGLDIANAAWTKIYAARSGEVYESGWCSGFGYCVKIDHGGGVVTIYGHLIKKPPVKVGQVVDVGDLIGYMGSTFDRSGGGYSTGVHLHFTIKVNGKAVNPMQFLP